jgi:hypothetical protein
MSRKKRALGRMAVWRFEARCPPPFPGIVCGERDSVFIPYIEYLPASETTSNLATSWIFVLNIPCQQNSENEYALNNYARFQSTK